MLEAVVGNDGVEGAVGEGEVGSVGLREIFDGTGGVVEVSADGDEWAHAGGKAAGAGSKVEDTLAGPGVFQDFVHGTVLAVVGCG